MKKNKSAAPIRSMTGFASRKGAAEGWSWGWDLRAVNARGFDLRTRLPDMVEGLEAGVRAALKPAIERGNVNLSLKLQRDAGAGPAPIDRKALAAVLATIRQIEETALGEHDLELAPTTAAEIMAMRALGDSGLEAGEQAALRTALLADLDALIADFNAMRTGEGAALAGVIAEQLGRIETLTARAAEAAEARRGKLADTLRENLARVLENSDGADADRVAQELALLAVKTDVTEECDRLAAHVAAARALLQGGGAVGRRLDFLTQEFMREANTLCSKAQSRELTQIGLDLKAVIDQMREQVQNVE